MQQKNHSKNSGKLLTKHFARSHLFDVICPHVVEKFAWTHLPFLYIFGFGAFGKPKWKLKFGSSTTKRLQGRKKMGYRIGLGSYHIGTVSGATNSPTWVLYVNNQSAWIYSGERNISAERAQCFIVEGFQPRAKEIRLRIENGGIKFVKAIYFCGILVLPLRATGIQCRKWLLIFWSHKSPDGCGQQGEALSLRFCKFTSRPR